MGKNPAPPTGFHTEILCLRLGRKVVRAECLKCAWFAAGSEEAVAVAERAHVCVHARFTENATSKPPRD